MNRGFQALTLYFRVDLINSNVPGNQEKRKGIRKKRAPLDMFKRNALLPCTPSPKLGRSKSIALYKSSGEQYFTTGLTSL
jgi:hypothetical protein